VAKKEKSKKRRKHDPAEPLAPEILRPLVVAQPVEQEPAAAADRGLAPLARLGGAQLCYGDAVSAGRRAVIPVARVRVAGGWGSGDRPDSRGGGGCGLVGADAVGYIEIDADGSRYVAIPRERRGVRAAGGALLAGAAGAALALAVGRNRRSAGRRRWSLLAR